MSYEKDERDLQAELDTLLTDIALNDIATENSWGALEKDDLSPEQRENAQAELLALLAEGAALKGRKFLLQSNVLFQDVQKQISQAKENVQNGAKTTYEAIETGVTSARDTAWSAMTGVVDSVVNNVQDAWEGVTKAAEKLAGAIKRSKVVLLAQAVGGALANKIAPSIASGWQGLCSVANGVAKAAEKVARQAINAVSGAVEDVKAIGRASVATYKAINIVSTFKEKLSKEKKDNNEIELDDMSTKKTASRGTP